MPVHQPFSLFHGANDDEDARKGWHLAFADAIARRRSVLDVGCGTGLFLDLARERGVAECIGLDRDPVMVAATEARGHPAILGDARTALSGFRSRFDAIYVSLVLETMNGAEGLAFLADCAAALRPDGLLMLRTLNPTNQAVRDGGFWNEPWNVRPWPVLSLQTILIDLGLRVAGVGFEPDGWQHGYIVGRAPSVADPAAARVAVAFAGSFFALNSLAHVDRELARALTAHPDVAPVIVPDEVRPDPIFADASGAAELRARTVPTLPACDVLVRQMRQQAGDARFSRPPQAKRVVEILPWEFGAIPQPWVDGTAALDEIWVPSTYNRGLFLNAGIAPERVAVIPNGIDPDVFRPEGDAEWTWGERRGTTLLFIGGTIHRKGPDVLLAAYRQAFGPADDVTLVVKDLGTRSFYVLAAQPDLFATFAADPQNPHLRYLDDDLTTAQVARLYRACDAFVFPYRGEGFGLPILEAMACGLPVIATGGGAADDFFDAEVGYPIPARRTAIGTRHGGVPLAGEGWLLEPEIDALAAILRHVVAHPEEARARGRAAAERARAHWTWADAANVAAGRLRALRAAGTRSA